jgi:hypothetical protein
MNPRSLSFRLGAWYTLLLSGTFVLVGTGTFFGLQHYLRSNLRDTLGRRSAQVEQILVQAPADAADRTIDQTIETAIQQSLCTSNSLARDSDLSLRHARRS